MGVPLFPWLFLLTNCLFFFNEMQYQYLNMFFQTSCLLHISQQLHLVFSEKKKLALNCRTVVHIELIQK